MSIIDERYLRHVAKFVPGLISKNISQFSRPLSPHLAAQIDKDDSIPRSDALILKRTKDLLSDHIKQGGRYALLETAGGVLSPGPSGTVQGDLYRPLRLPTILVGDSKLGGIATTISAFESLHLRGYDVDSVVMFDDPDWGNLEFLDKYFRNHNISTFGLPQPPTRHDDEQRDKTQLQKYYDVTTASRSVTTLTDLLNDKHFKRISTLTSMPSQADEVIWHPFRQHGIPHNIIAIDSAYEDHFQTYNAETDSAIEDPDQEASADLKPLASTKPSSQPLLTPLFDASASWWTQGLGHGNPTIALTAAHAAGRYGHVMFAHAVHQPALDISYNLLQTLQNPRLSRVFFTDNGSTGMEVAVKMALRASCARYGWTKDAGETPVEILGLKGSYHGDTIGVMNCSEPSVFNEKVDWHQPWGHWFDPPSLLFQKGEWTLTIPAETSPSGSTETQIFTSLPEIFDFDARREDASRYQDLITRTLKHLTQDQGRRFGALILEPLLMGAGGMIFVDPLFQRTLIRTVRDNPDLIHPSQSQSISGSKTETAAETKTDWTGLPIIADEVFTGLYRLGRASSSSFLSSPSDFPSPSPPPSSNHTTPQPPLPASLSPDISVHAKLLTAGLLPLALTTASSSIFNTFLSSDKTDALLHGHSYTAHPVGCMVANKALDEYRRMDGPGASGNGGNGREGAWEEFKAAWSTTSASNPNGKNRQQQLYSFFPPHLLDTLSHHPRLKGVFALGTVLVLKLAPESSASTSPSSTSGGGYTSTASATLQSALLTVLDEEGRGIHSRVLGDVIYFMASLTTSREQIERVGRVVLRALDGER